MEVCAQIDLHQLGFCMREFTGRATEKAGRVTIDVGQILSGSVGELHALQVSDVVRPLFAAREWG